MEVCKGSTPPNESDMGVSHEDAVPVVCSAGGYRFITMERSEHIGVRNAKILLLGAFETTNADDTE